MIELLSDRMKVAESIGRVKKEANVAVLQRSRWQEVIDTMVKEGVKKELSAEFIESIFKAIHQESIKHQEKIINNFD